MPHTQSVQSQVNYYLQPISQSPKASQRQHSSSSRKSKLASIQASNPQPRLHAAFVSSIFHLSTLSTHTSGGGCNQVHKQPVCSSTAIPQSVSSILGKRNIKISSPAVTAYLLWTRTACQTQTPPKPVSINHSSN